MILECLCQMTTVSMSKSQKPTWMGRKKWDGFTVFNTCNKCQMLILFKVQALPLLEYCCPLWCSTNQNVGLIRALENVQRSFTSRIWGMTELNYWDRLRELKLYSLERERERLFYICVENLTQLVPNFSCDNFWEYYTDKRRGLLCRASGTARWDSRS